MKSLSLMLAVAVFSWLLLGCGGGPAGTPSDAPPPAEQPPGDRGISDEGWPETSATPEIPPAGETRKPPALDIAVYPEETIFRIDHPVIVRLVLKNNSPDPVVLDRAVNFLSGFEINDARLGVKYAGEEEKLDRPLVIPPGAFIGARVDLARHFPILRKPGPCKIRWSDPDLGGSKSVEIDVTDYVLLVTDYGDVAVKLLPGAAPDAAAQFRRLAARGFYDDAPVSGLKPDKMVVVTPAAEKAADFADQYAPLKQETTTEEITSGDVVVIRLLDVESLSRGLPERPEFFNTGTPGFFVQLAPAAPAEKMKYTVFGRVFRGLEVLNDISRALQARGLQGQKLSIPAEEIRIRRAVLVEDACDRPAAPPPEGAKPEASLALTWNAMSVTYGEPLPVQVTISNAFDAPLRLPETGAAKGLKVFRLEAGGENAVLRAPVEISKDFPDQPLRAPKGHLPPGGFVGATLDISGLSPAFAEGGTFEILWEDQGIRSEPVTIRVQKSLFAKILTGKGGFEVVLFEESAPLAVERFRQLAQRGFYDNLAFHRVINTPALGLAQTGSPTGDETGKADGEPIPLEPGDRKFREGTVAFAHTPADPDSGSSQYFIVTRVREDGSAALYGRYTVIGEIAAAYDDKGNPADFRAILGAITEKDKVIKVEISEKKPQWNSKEEP